MSKRNSLTTLAILTAGVGTVMTVVALQTTSPTGLLDLRIYLGAAASRLDGASIYDYSDATFGLGSTYPPAWSVLLSPLTWVNIHVVEFAWTIAMVLGWYFTLRLLALRRQQSLSEAIALGTAEAPRTAVLWLATLPTAPVWNTVNQGQVNFLVWFLLVLDVSMVVRRTRWAGAFAGIAGAIKLVPLFFVGVYALARKVQASLRGVLVFTVATLLGALAAFEDSRRYWFGLLLESDRVGDLDATENNSLAGLIYRMGASRGASVVVSACVVVALLILQRGWLARAMEQGKVLQVCLVGGCLASLASPISWTHHLVFLCFGLLLLWNLPWRSLTWRFVITGAAWLALVDPIGFGRMTETSALRAAAMVLMSAAPIVGKWTSGSKAGSAIVGSLLERQSNRESLPQA